MPNWKAGTDYPEWMTTEGLQTLQGGYLYKSETPKEMYQRVAKAASDELQRPALGLEDKFFEIMWRGWLCPASPVLTNLGTTRGIPISCYGVQPDDDLHNIFTKAREAAMLSKGGGGVGIGISKIRPRGSLVGELGVSDGVIPWCKLFEASSAAKQGQLRKGAFSVNLDVTHPDFPDFLRLHDTDGDPNLRTPRLHTCVNIPDEFMVAVEAGDEKARAMWREILMTRMKRGEPYILFSDTVNRANPAAYLERGLRVDHTNICSEIVLASDRKHTYVCCLASQNLTRFPDLSRNESVYWGTWFLDGVMSIFIRLAGKAKVYANAVRFAEKSRAIGMGALGYHAALQDRMMPFASLGARLQNRSMFEHIQVESDRASQDLAREYGEPEWCQGTGFRHTHRRAVAPTFSNAIISGTDAQSIEPLIVNAGTAGTSKGVALRKNPRLDRILTESGRNSPEIWQSIVREQGSIQHLDMLSAEEKEVFKTAFEIDQREIVRQAADRQKYIDQSQSLNLFFTQDASPKYVNETHLLAHKLGVKTLYYLRSTAPLRADSASRQTTVAAETGGPAPCGSACEG